MKKLKQIFALCLSLFCIFGLMTPVFADGESNENVTLFEYEIHTGDENGEVPINLCNQDRCGYRLLTNQKYFVRIRYAGDLPEEAENNYSDWFASKMNSEYFELSDVGGNTDEYYGKICYTVDYYVTPKKMSDDLFSVEVAPGQEKRFDIAYNPDDPAKFVSLAVFDATDNVIDGSNQISRIDTGDSNTYAFNVKIGSKYDVAFRWYGTLEDGAGTNRLQHFIDSGLFTVGDHNGLTGNGKSSLGAGWESYDITPSKVGVFKYQIMQGITLQLNITDDNQTPTPTPTEEPKSENEVITNVAEGAPKTTTKVDVPTIVENAKKNNLLSEEQVAAVEQGGSTDVKVTVAKKEATAEEKKLVEAQLNSTNKVGMYLDLGVAVVVKDANGNVIGNDVAVSETGAPVTFTVALDDTLINTNSAVDRTYQVIRIHNGEVTVLPATFDAEGKTITFATDKFSTYALIYTDTPKKAKTPSTADTNTTGLYLVAMVAGLLACALVVRRKRA